MRKVLLLILLAVIAVVGVTCALNIFDKKARAGPDIKDVPYVAISQSRIYYLADPGDAVYEADTDTNIIYRYWGLQDGKWEYSEDVMVLPVDTFGPIKVRKRAL